MFLHHHGSTADSAVESTARGAEFAGPENGEPVVQYSVPKQRQDLKRCVHLFAHAFILQVFHLQSPPLRPEYHEAKTIMTGQHRGDRQALSRGSRHSLEADKSWWIDLDDATVV